MKRIAIYCTIVIIATGLLFVIKEVNSFNGVLSSKRPSIEYLSQQLLELQPGSPEAHNMLNDIKKILGKHPSTKGLTENPHVLIEAFAEIKTNSKGRTYEPGYLQREIQTALKRKRAATPLPWKERGPGNCSGRIRAVLPDPDDGSGNSWFAVSVGGGIWKTEDGGSSWQNKTPDMLTLSTMCIAMAASNHNVIYAGTGMGYGRVVDLAGSGVWKSIDHGESWFQLASTANGELLPAINRIVVDPEDENTLLICSNGDYTQGGPNGGDRPSGIFKSTDGGTSWRQVYDPEPVFGPGTDNRIQQIIADPQNFDRLYASVNEVGVIRSINAGETWTISADNFARPQDIGNPPGGPASYQGISVRTELAISLSDPRRLYAAVERPYGVADLYMSQDRGASWQIVTDLGGDPNWFNSRGISGAYAYAAGWFDNTIMVAPNDPNVVFVGGVSLYRIDVNTGSSTRYTNRISGYLSGPGISVVHSDMHDLQYILDSSVPGGFKILNANDGGVALSPNGGQSWIEYDRINTSQFYGVDKKPGENVYMGGLQDNGTYLSQLNPDENSNWAHILGGDGFEAAWNHKNPDLMLGCSQGGTLYRSTDGGQAWTTLSNPIEGFAPFITKIASSKQDADLLFSLSSNGIFRSDDFGASWTLTPIPGPWVGHRAFSNVEISTADPRFVWASSKLTYDDAAQQPGGIYVSSDTGLTFSSITSNLPEGLTESSGMGFDPVDPNVAYILFSAVGTPKILRTKDLGQTFEDLSGGNNGFPDVATYSVLVMPHNRQIIWAGTEIGLFISEDDGQTWAYADNGLPRVGIFQMTLVDGQIILATYGRGIWTVDLPELEGYQPPQVVLSPRITNVAYQPTGNLAVNLDMRSNYDQTELYFNGNLAMSVESNEAAKTIQLLYPIDEETNMDIHVVSTVGSNPYRSATKQIATYPIFPAKSFQTTLTDATGFTLSGLQLSRPGGFSSTGLHSPHPYQDSSEYIAQLENPYLVPEENAVIRYRDIAIVEAGSGSGVFGDAQFWDYVIVEGTKDGFNWLPLRDGYDSRYDSRWLSAEANGTNPTESVYVDQEIDVLVTFEPGDQIFIRFRLWSDGGVTGWGWAVDDIEIFPTEPPGNLNLSRQMIYPWVSYNQQFESTLIVNNTGDEPVDCVFTARRSDGFGERTAVKAIPPRGFLKQDASDLFSHLYEGRGFTVILESSSDQIAGRWITQNLTTITGKSPSQGLAIPMESAVSRKLLFGFMPTTDGFTSAPAIVSLGSNTSSILLSLVDEQGQLTEIPSIELNKKDRPLAQLVTDWLPNADRDYYLIAESTQAPITGTSFVFNTFGEPSLGSVTNIENPGEQTELIFPWISNSQNFESNLVVNNLGTSESEVTLIARRGDGSTSQSIRTIPASGFLNEKASALFPDLPVGFGFTVTAEASTGPVTGRWVTFNLDSVSGKSPSQGVAFEKTPADTERDWLFGFMPVTDDLISALVVVNRSDSPTDVTLEFFNRNGVMVWTDQTLLQSLQPNLPYPIVINDLEAITEDVAIVARSSSGELCGVAFIFNRGREPAIGNATPIANYMSP